MSNELPGPDTTIGGRYRLLRAIGEGGMGAVYEAEHTELGRRVALKIVRAGDDVGPEHYARLEREARATATLGHPNIVSVIDFGVSETAGAFLVMELLHGESLADRIARKGRVADNEVLNIGLQVLDGLAAAHAAGMVHRDLKPANIFLVPLASGAHLAKLLDFGIVKLREENLQPKLTNAGMILGTVVYMAPEQIRMQVTDARSDIYSMGATLYEALSGMVPFSGETQVHIAHQILLGPPRDIAEVVPGIDPVFARVIRRAMANDPAERYPDAAAMRDALRSLVRVGAVTIGPRGPGAQAMPAPVLQPPRPPPAQHSTSARTNASMRIPTNNRRIGVWALSGMLAVALIGIGVTWYATSGDSPAPAARAQPEPRTPEPAPQPAPTRAPEPALPIGIDEPIVEQTPVVSPPETTPVTTAPIARPPIRRPRPVQAPSDNRPAREPGILNPFE